MSGKPRMFHFRGYGWLCMSEDASGQGFTMADAWCDFIESRARMARYRKEQKDKLAERVARCVALDAGKPDPIVARIEQEWAAKCEPMGFFEWIRSIW